MRFITHHTILRGLKRPKVNFPCQLSCRARDSTKVPLAEALLLWCSNCSVLIITGTPPWVKNPLPCVGELSPAPRNVFLKYSSDFQVNLSFWSQSQLSQSLSKIYIKFYSNAEHVLSMTIYVLNISIQYSSYIQHNSSLLDSIAIDSHDTHV